MSKGLKAENGMRMSTHAPGKRKVQDNADIIANYYLELYLNDDLKAS
jgi:hypothetical protein